MYNHAKIANSQHLFAQLWKEYALSDSRYLTSDPFMLCVESITVVSLPFFCCAASRTDIPQQDFFSLLASWFPDALSSQVIWGPLCFVTALSYARQRHRRHPLAIITSVAHLYGVALYYSTCYVEEAYKGIVYSRPEFLYFWIYYVGFNAPWVIVPIGKQVFVIICPGSCKSCPSKRPWRVYDVFVSL